MENLSGMDAILNIAKEENKAKVISLENTNLKAALETANKLSGVNSTEINLTILKTNALVKPLTGNDDLLQKTLKSSGATFIRNFNKILFNNTTFEDITFEDLEDFEKNLSPVDKSLLTYALLEATYTELPEKILTCPHCDSQHSYKLTPKMMLQEDTLQKPWIHEEEPSDYIISKEIIEGITINYSMPTEFNKVELLKTKDNEELKKNVEQDGSILSNTEMISLYIKSIDIKKSDKEIIILQDRKDEILPFLNEIPLDLKSKIIEDDSITEFLEYTPNFYFKLVCNNLSCEKEFIWDADPESDFFRKSLLIYAG